MPSHRTPILVVFLGLVLGLGAAPPAIADGGGLDTATAPRQRIVQLGDGDAVAVTPASVDGPSAVQALPRSTGAAPGLFVGSGPTGTYLTATDTDAAPAMLSGDAPGATTRSGEESVELHLGAVGRDGRDASALVMLFDVETGEVQASRRIPGDPGAECTADSWDESSCVLVPPGTYSAMAFVTTMPLSRPSTVPERTVQSVSLVGDPEMVISDDRDLEFDARRAEPITVDTPGHRTSVTPGGAMSLGYTRTAANGQSFTGQVLPTSMMDETFYAEPTEPVRTGGFSTLTRLRLEEPDIELSLDGQALGAAYYDPVWFSDFAADWPVFDGRTRLPIADVGSASADDIGDRDLQGTLAVAERSDELSVAEQSNAAAAAGASMIVIYNDRPGDNDDPNGTGTKVTIPTLRISRAEGLALAAAADKERASVRGESASRYVYDLVITEDERIPSDLSYVYATSQLAMQRHAVHGQPGTAASYSEAAYPFRPGDEFSISTMFPMRDGPRVRTEYRLPDPHTQWSYAVATPELKYNTQFPQEPVLPMTLSTPELQTYRPHQRSHESFGTAPIVAGFNVPVERSGDSLRIAINGFTDADGNSGRAHTDDSGMATQLRVTADGDVVAETNALPHGVATLPAGSSRVEIAFTADNPQPWASLSTHTETRWSFDSTTTADGAVVTEPLIMADYDLPVDLHNRVRTSGSLPAAFTLGLGHQDGADGAGITDARMAASFDDGQTWQQAALTRRGDRYRVVLPPGKGHVSLRLRATDTAGSELEQTIIRAFVIT